jgi:UDP-2,3-diacylglucosamine pyrophosphatase LpxH
MPCSNHPDRTAHARGLCRRCYDGLRGGNAPASPQNPYAGRRGAERPGATVKGDTATVVSGPDIDLGDVDGLIRSRGLDPADWEVVSATLNEWDGPVAGGGTQMLRQLKVSLKRRQPLHWLFPAVDVEPRVRTVHADRYASRDPERPQTIVLLPDPHCPYEDRELDARVESMIYGLEPDRITILGDVCDFSSVSRHRDNPAWFASAQENIQAAFQWLAGKRDASSGCPIDWIEGNHDARLRYELLQRAERVYGLRPADIPGQEGGPDALSLEHLCHLDRLGIDFVGPPLDGDEYHHAAIDLAAGLHARHGFITGANSPAKTLERVGMNVVLGHTHRHDRHTKAVYRGSRHVGNITAWECGTLARVEGGMGYASNPNWHQGLAVATVFADGEVDVELVPYLDGALRFRGRRY